MQDPPEPWAVCRRHPCSSESCRLRRCGTLARGAARTGWPVCTGAASTSGAVRGGGDVARRRPAWVGPAAGGGIGSESEPEPWSAVAAACPVARLALASGGSGAVAARAHGSAACKTRRSPGRFAGGTLFSTSLSTAPVLHASRGSPRTSRPVCTGAASAPAAARRRRRRDKRRSSFGRAVGGSIGSEPEPEPEPWSAAAAACPAARLARTAGGRDVLAGRAHCATACWTRQRFGWFASRTLVPASFFDCAGVACFPAAQLGPAGLSENRREFDVG